MRSAKFEAAFLDDVSVKDQLLSPVGWQRKVRDRLDQGAADYGDDSYRLPTQQLLDELEQEATDLPAWSSIVAAGLHRRFSCPDEAKDLLTDIGSFCPQILRKIERLRELAID